MSKSEFDRYLALLNGLLKLSPVQREAIASELRDHLEERLGELLAQGVSKQKAIETALEEFGDATGLAGEFVQIFQQQRRRWMMRITFGTAAVISLIVLVTSALWPDSRSGPSPRRATAQEEVTAADSRGPLYSPLLSDADRRAEASLYQRIDVDYIDQRFTDVLADLGVSSELQFYVKQRYLEDLGIDTDAPVNMSLKDVSVEMALGLILESLDLTYVIRDGVVLITTDEDFDNMAEVRVYNCRDLLETAVDDEADQDNSESIQEIDDNSEPVPSNQNKKKRGTKKKSADNPSQADQSRRAGVPNSVLAQFGGGGMGGGGMGGRGGRSAMQGDSAPERQLMNIITIAVKPDSWEDVGGPGTIGEFDGMIVIRHNPRVHRQVERVLHMLRDASGQQDWSNAAGFRVHPGGGGGFF